MCKMIDAFLAKIRSHGDLVYDGTGPADVSDFEKLEDLRVQFSGSDKEADDIIEVLIADNTAPKRLKVISDDRRLIAAGKKRKAMPIDCLSFWSAMIEKLNQKPKLKEPAAKQSGISDGETDKWLKEFGF